MAPFNEVAALLYEGPWVAERYAALRPFLAKHAREVHPVTRRIVEKAKAFSAADAFAGLYRLEALRRATEPMWRGIDALAVPTAPCAPTLREVEADPLGPNSKLGTYTNFVNLLDLAAIAVPGAMRKDGRAAGITLIGPRGRDAALASLGRVFHAASATTIGATGRPLPPLQPLPPAAPAGTLELAVVGAHLSGMALNHELRSAGGTLPARRRHRGCLRALRAARRPAGASGSGARGGGNRARHRHRGVGAAGRGLRRASSPASRRRSASARCCSPTAPGPRASCARPRPSAPPGTSPPSAAGAPTSRPRAERRLQSHRTATADRSAALSASCANSMLCLRGG